MGQFLFEDTCTDTDPFAVFAEWMAHAREKEPYNTDAAAVATADKNGIPSVRVLLLKFFDENGFVFFTNMNSQKGQELAENPHAAFTIYWKTLKQQIRAQGPVTAVSAADSDAYFQSRKHGSRIASIASQQSAPLPARHVYDDAITALSDDYAESDPPRPAHWRGFRIQPLKIEFWQEEEFRAHQRRVFHRDDITQNTWQTTLLYP